MELVSTWNRIFKIRNCEWPSLYK